MRTAAGILRDDDGNLLLIHENYGERRFGPPGGLVEPGESPIEAVVRETREETSLIVQPRYLIGAYFFPDGQPPFLAFAFACETIRGQPRVPESNEIASVGWVDPGRLPTPLTNLAPYAIHDFLAGRRNLLRTVRI